MARNFLASTILLLCNLGAFDLVGESVSVDNRLVRAWKQFQFFWRQRLCMLGACEASAKKDALC